MGVGGNRENLYMALQSMIRLSVLYCLKQEDPGRILNRADLGFHRSPWAIAAV